MYEIPSNYTTTLRTKWPSALKEEYNQMYQRHYSSDNVNDWYGTHFSGCCIFNCLNAVLKLLHKELLAIRNVLSTAAVTASINSTCSTGWKLTDFSIRMGTLGYTGGHQKRSNAFQETVSLLFCCNVCNMVKLAEYVPVFLYGLPLLNWLVNLQSRSVAHRSYSENGLPGV